MENFDLKRLVKNFENTTKRVSTRHLTLKSAPAKLHCRLVFFVLAAFEDFLLTELQLFKLKHSLVIAPWVVMSKWARSLNTTTRGMSDWFRDNRGSSFLPRKYPNILLTTLTRPVFTFQLSKCCTEQLKYI